MLWSATEDAIAREGVACKIVLVRVDRFELAFVTTPSIERHLTCVEYRPTTPARMRRSRPHQATRPPSQSRLFRGTRRPVRRYTLPHQTATIPRSQRGAKGIAVAWRSLETYRGYAVARKRQQRAHEHPRRRVRSQYCPARPPPSRTASKGRWAESTASWQTSHQRSAHCGDRKKT